MLKPLHCIANQTVVLRTGVVEHEARRALGHVALDGLDLLRDHREHLELDAVELVEAGPRARRGQALEELAHRDVVERVAAVEHDALLRHLQHVHSTTVRFLRSESVLLMPPLWKTYIHRTELLVRVQYRTALGRYDTIRYRFREVFGALGLAAPGRTLGRSAEVQLQRTGQGSAWQARLQSPIPEHSKQ